MYLGSISARACQYGYINVAPNRLILCNSSSVPSEHGDRLMDFGIGELGLHFVYFKDTEFLIKIRELLKLPSQGCYCILLTNLVTLLNKFKLDKVDTFINERGYHVMVNHGATEYDGKNTVAFPIYNFHVEKRLFDYWNYIQDIGSEAHRQMYPHFEFDVPLNPKIVGRVYFFDFDLKSFRDGNNQPVVDNEQSMRMMAIDGITCPSLSDFIKKLGDDPFTLKGYLWMVSKSAVFSIMKFDNAVAHVISLRPNLMALRLPDTVSIETRKSLATMLESNNE